MKRLLLFATAIFTCIFSYSQLLSWTPPFPVENDPAQTLVITMDATKGNQGLLNYTTSDVYVHIGVITNKSTSATDWKHVLSTWGSTDAAFKAISLGNNKWQFTITGSLRTYFGLTDVTETIQSIAILFRSGSGSLKQSNTNGNDMYVPIYTTALAVRVDLPPSQPTYIRTPEPQSWTVGSSFTVTAYVNKPSTIKLYHNSSTPFASVTNGQIISAVSSVTTTGNQQIIAEANDGTTIKYDTLNIFVNGGSPVADLPGGVRDGINYEPGDTSVTLVLRAPGKGMVTVIGDFNNWIQTTGSIMNKTPDGKFFWLRLHPLVPGTEYAYQYLVDNSTRIADPYTEKILDPNNDQNIPSTVYPNLKPYPSGQTGLVSILQTAQPSYAWGSTSYSRPDKRGLVIYELLVRDFVANHDWKTIRDSLNYLKNLGINAIEVMPFNEFEGNDSWGYNPDFYFAPDKYYGTKNALKAFIDSCHNRGIAVIMDIALNHSFGSSPMVQLYWDAVNNRPAPNNPWFNPVAKHDYNVGFDMNHESLDTRYFVSRVLEHWTQQYKIDGFRFDLSKGFTQKQTCDNNGGNCNDAAFAAYDSSRVAIWKRYYDTLQLKSTGAYAILEHFADNTEETDLSNYGMLLWGNLNDSYAQASMGYPDRWDFSWGIYTTRGWTKPHLVTYMESHDEERIVYKNENFGNASGSYNIKDTTTALKRMELDAAFFFTIPGPKMLWQFGELGYDYPINYCQNGTINNNCRLDRKPIRWDYLNDPRRRSVYNLYSKLIQLRFNPAYRDAFISGVPGKNLSSAFKYLTLRSAADTSDLVVVGNFDINVQTGSVVFPVAGTWYDYLDNTTLSTSANAQSFTLQPGEYKIYVNRNVNNIAVTPVSNVSLNSNLLMAKVFPNPTNADFNLQIQMPQSRSVTVSLFTSTGQFLSTVFNGFVQQGSRDIPLKETILPPGIYYLQVKAGTEIRTIQLTKL
jgi:1,4-alpha-glucan branching enzyme